MPVSAPVITYVGSITASGGTFTVPVDLPAYSVIIIPVDTSGTATASDTAGNTYIGSNNFISCFETLATPAGTTITVTNTPDPSVTSDFFYAELYTITGVDQRQGKYTTPQDGNTGVRAYQVSNATSSSPWSATTNVASYFSSVSLDITHLKGIAFIYFTKLSSSSSPPSDTGTDSFTAGGSHSGSRTFSGGGGFPTYYKFRSAYKAEAPYAEETISGTYTNPFFGIGFTIIGLFVPETVTPNDKLDIKYDRKTSRRYTAAIQTTGEAVIYNDDVKLTHVTTALTPVMVDNAVTCKFPNICILKDSGIVYTYDKAGDIFWRISKNIGKTWSAAVSVATGFTAHDLIMDELGMFLIMAAFKTTDSHIYIITGKYNAGSIAWNTPVDTGYQALEVSPGICLHGSVYELTYRDTANAIQIVRCSKLSALGVGAWS